MAYQVRKRWRKHHGGISVITAWREAAKNALAKHARINRKRHENNESSVIGHQAAAWHRQHQRQREIIRENNAATCAAWRRRKRIINAVKRSNIGAYHQAA